MDRYRRGGRSLWIDDGFPPGTWAAMAECIRRADKGEKVTNWTCLRLSLAELPAVPLAPPVDESVFMVPR